jgi:hypothetical protein
MASDLGDGRGRSTREWGRRPRSISTCSISIRRSRAWRRSIPKEELAVLAFSRGLSLEAGDAVGISVATAERDWQAARASLIRDLRGEQPHDA